MTVIDETTDSVSKTVSLGTHPQALAIDEQSDQIYVGNQRTSSVTVIDGRTNLPVVKIDVGTIPYAFGIDAPAHLVYVANFSSNNVTVIQLPAGKRGVATR
jgi:YVTN family beta-propeller protein